jgi:hypothetical protein
MPLGRRKAGCDPLHLGVPAQSTRISEQLPFEIAKPEAGEPRGAGAVAEPIEPMAGEAGIRRAGSSAAQGDQFPGLGEAIG